MQIKHLLFDLDGTLLPMKQDEFVQYYMPLLAKKMMEHGLSMDIREFIKIIWAGYEAMVANDGTMTNEEQFWGFIGDKFQMPRQRAEEICLNFYENEFNQAICTTKPTPVSNQIIQAAKEKKIRVYLATNPVFPKTATRNRMKWAGLKKEDFEIVTTYEDCRFCKPNARYFAEIMKQFQLKPEECLMVGNDVEEDLAIRSLGVKTYLVTDTMENKKNLPIESEYKGTLVELLELVKTL